MFFLGTRSLTSLASHRIDTGGHPPIAEPLRRHHKAYLDVIDQSIDRLVEAEICKPCSSPWAANIVLMKKKDSPVPSVTANYRKLNEITVKDKFPLPRISDCLDALSGAVFFSSFDQSHAVFQLPLATQDDKNKTTRPLLLRDAGSFVSKFYQWVLATAPVFSPV